jgi:hypothetical protein
MDFLQTLWADAAGKIFLITVGSTLFGYMVHGGYMFTFFGRRENLPFGLSDFSIIDLISIFPTAIVTFFNIIPKAFFEFLKIFIIHFVIPVTIGIIIRSSGFQLDQFLFGTTWLVQILNGAGFFIWASCYFFAIIQSRNLLKVFIVIVEFLGAILYFVTLSTMGGPSTTINISPAQTQILYAIFATTIFPYVFGVLIARKAIKSNLLVRIERLTLRQPILKEGMKKVTTSTETGNKPSFRELWLAQKSLPVDMEPDAYEWSATPDKNLYLIATFEKFVLLFTPIPGPEPEDGTTIMLNRDMILSMETGTTAPSKPQQG